ncbi:MAG: hypothetical protein JNK37_04700 [Verrucomicrobiales bacterium]|nr:hypothetical protein [Verrucomicrobiales bacterium]
MNEIIHFVHEIVHSFHLSEKPANPFRHFAHLSDQKLNETAQTPNETIHFVQLSCHFVQLSRHFVHPFQQNENETPPFVHYSRKIVNGMRHFAHRFPVSTGSPERPSIPIATTDQSSRRPCPRSGGFQPPWWHRHSAPAVRRLGLEPGRSRSPERTHGRFAAICREWRGVGDLARDSDAAEMDRGTIGIAQRGQCESVASAI